jgi:hypothetical protein
MLHQTTVNRGKQRNGHRLGGSSVQQGGHLGLPRHGDELLRGAIPDQEGRLSPCERHWEGGTNRAKSEHSAGLQRCPNSRNPRPRGPVPGRRMPARGRGSRPTGRPVLSEALE